MATILIIDDEESIRFTFESFLKKEGYEVLAAPDFKRAGEIIGQINFDMAFVDIALGGYTGIDVLREVKNRGLGCPVVMITGKPTIDTAAEAVRLGAYDYLPKPVRKDTLLRVTEQALRHKNLLDEKNRMQMENEQYRSNLEAIFQSVKDGIITVDRGMNVINMNQASEKICGFTDQAFVGSPFPHDSLTCEKSCQLVLEETLETKHTVEHDRVECRHSNGISRVVNLTGTPLLDRNDQFVGAVLVVKDVTRMVDLERELQSRSQFHNIVGKSEKMQEIFKLIRGLSGTDSTVLVTGESGTGKELVAEALHNGGPRSSKPLVKVNCSALAENLLESELFGHIAGAFTGAIKNKIGRFEAAHGGTIFLDEIGDISPAVQLKLLRVLQEKEIERVGESIPRKVDVRVITATNRDLREKVRLGEFREDLYYRLKVVEISLPPLRERRDDIPLLIHHFYEYFRKSFKKNIDGLSDQALKVLFNYSWPGNVRELQHAVEHGFVLCGSGTIMAEHLPLEIREQTIVAGPAPKKDSGNEHQEILEALRKTGWNKAKAARLLGVSRPTIYRKISEYNLEDPVN